MKFDSINIRLILQILIISSVFVLSLFPISTVGGGINGPFTNSQTVEEYVHEYFMDIPIMAQIAGCESRFRHFGRNGNVIRGEENQFDVGVMQINEHFHLVASKQAGYDIYTLAGNIGYARYLYEKSGVAPWTSSSPCWDV